MQQGKSPLKRSSSLPLPSASGASPKIIFVKINVIMQPLFTSHRIIKYAIVCVLFFTLLRIVCYFNLVNSTNYLMAHNDPKLEERGSELGNVDMTRNRLKSRINFKFDNADSDIEVDDVILTPVFDPRSLTVVEETSPPKPADIVILITSAVDNRRNRDAIRRSWCTPDITKGDEVHYFVQCLFLLGQSIDVIQNAAARAESHLHQDILIGDFIDSYRNLSLKVLTGFQWVDQHYSAKLKFILKTDDDCFINTRLFSLIMSQHNKKNQGLYIGNVFRTSRTTQVIRDPYSKWYVSREQFAPDFYPHYASGTGYLMSRDALTKLLWQSQYCKPFPNEDAYVGVLMEKAGIIPSHSDRFTLFSNKWGICNFMFLIVIHDVDAKYQQKFQNNAINAWTKCRAHGLITEW